MTRSDLPIPANRLPAELDLATYVVNLRRRTDRRTRMRRILPAGLRAAFTSDWTGRFDGQDLDRPSLDEAGIRLFPWRIESDNPWWRRPLKYGEIGCSLAHLACWRHAAAIGREFALILEDDVELAVDFLPRLVAGLRQLRRGRDPFGLLYLGRYPLEPDRARHGEFVSPGYSHCTFAYLVTRRAVQTLLEARIQEAVVPVDEFLPAMYVEHPRIDVRNRFPPTLRALAFSPPLATQLPKEIAGSDTEASDFVDEPSVTGARAAANASAAQPSVVPSSAPPASGR